jgi:hypothetical protein
VFWWQAAAAFGIDDVGAEIIVYTVRQYHRTRKAEFLRDFTQEARSAAALLGDELAGLRFNFATIGKDFDTSTAVRIEFHGKESDSRIVWVDVKGGAGGEGFGAGVDSRNGVSPLFDLDGTSGMAT